MRGDTVCLLLLIALLLVLFAILSILHTSGGEGEGCTVFVSLLIVVAFVAPAAWAVSLV